jgi:predicted PolB exonuclease-like 3'-5' exonuclease
MRTDRPKELSKILFLDIETVPQQLQWEQVDPELQRLFLKKTRVEQERSNRTAAEVYVDRAGIQAEFAKVICIGLGRMCWDKDHWELRVSSFQGDDEKQLLQQFSDLLDRHYNTDEHWLCGHNVREFDLPFLARRCIVNRVRLPRLLDNSGAKPWEIGHLDTMSLWCFGDRKAYTSLELLAYILGVPTPKDDISGADVARLYHIERDIDRIARYCRKDVITTAQVYLRITGGDLVQEHHIKIT